MFKVNNGYWVWSIGKPLFYNNNFYYKYNGNTLAIMHMRYYSDKTIFYNNEYELCLKLTLTNMLRTRHANTLCNFCGIVKNVRETNYGFYCCDKCYFDLGKITFIHNIRPKASFGMVLEEGIDYAYKLHNKVIFLCRTTLNITKYSLIHDIYFDKLSWFNQNKYHGKCNFCHVNHKFYDSSCKQCYEYARQLFLTIWVISNMTEVNDVNAYILYLYIYFISGDIEYDVILNVKDAPKKEKIIDEIKEEITEEKSSEESIDVDYIMDNYEELYGLNDQEQVDDELGYWGDN